MKNKKILIIILVLVIVLLLGGGAFAYVYFATDLLKSDDQLFYEYLSKVGSTVKSFDSEELEQYFEKLETTPYKNEGTLTVDVDMPDMAASDLERINDVNITFSGSVDKANDMNEQNIKLNYSDDVSLPITYRHIDNVYALMSDLIVTKYVGIDVDNLDNLLTNLGVDVSELESAIATAQDANELDIDETELKGFLTKYKDIIKQSLTKDMFTKAGQGAVSLKLTPAQLQTVLTNVLTALQSESFVSDDLSADIDTMLDDLAELDVTQPVTIVITAYDTGTITIGVDDTQYITIQANSSGIQFILSADEVTETISIDKLPADGGASYSISLGVSDQSSSEFFSMLLKLTANYTGIQTDEANENYVLEMGVTNDDDTISYTYTFDTTKTFVNNINIEKLDASNALFIDTLDADTLNQLVTVIGSQISSVTLQQMQQLGLTMDQYPLLYASPLGLIVQALAAVHPSIVDPGEDPTYNQPYIDSSEPYSTDEDTDTDVDTDTDGDTTTNEQTGTDTNTSTPAGNTTRNTTSDNFIDIELD